jgi:hypothetical protein
MSKIITLIDILNEFLPFELTKQIIDYTGFHNKKLLLSSEIEHVKHHYDNYLDYLKEYQEYTKMRLRCKKIDRTFLVLVAQYYQIYLSKSWSKDRMFIELLQHYY